MNVRHFLFWLPMIPLAFVNASLREIVLRKHFSEITAQQLSTITLLLFCFVYTWFVFSKLRILSSRQALLVGISWMALTVIFEFSLGLLLKHPLEELLANYDIAKGKLWPVFLVGLSLMPYFCLKVKS